MSEVMTIRQAVKRAKEEKMRISEGAVRQLVKKGKIPVRFIGKRKALIFYPALLRYLQCIDGGDVQAEVTEDADINRAR